MAILWFILILGGIVLVHEFGPECGDPFDENDVQ